MAPNKNVVVEPTLQARLGSEFIGTFFLVLTVFCNILSGTSAAFAAVSIASVLMIMVYSLGDISGAHLNPAVTASISLSGQQPWQTSGYYIGMQVVGGLFAAVVSRLIFGQGIVVGPSLGFNWAQASAAEFLYTLMLCFLVLNVACCRKNGGNQYFGLAIGYVIVAGGYAVGGISGANLNPAVTLALDLTGGKPFYVIPYVFAQVAAAVAAYGLFKVVRPEEFQTTTSTILQVLDPALIAEFVGTFFLVLTVGCVSLNGTLTGAFAIGSTLSCMIYALGSCSGSHFNPAVTLTILLTKRDYLITNQKALQYVGAQVAGATLAALTYAALFKGETFPLAPAPGYGWGRLAVAEIVFTFVLCYVVLSVATVKSMKLRDLFGFAIGMCVTVGGYAGSALGGGCLNPAAAFGIAAVDGVFAGQKLFLNALGYASLECVGAVGAAGLFQFVTHAEECRKKA